MSEGLQRAADEAAATVTGETGQQPVPGDEASTALDGVARAKGLEVKPDAWFMVPGGTALSSRIHDVEPVVVEAKAVDPEADEAQSTDTKHVITANHMTPGHYAGRSAHFH